MPEIQDDIAEIDREITRLLNSPYEPAGGEILDVCRRILRTLRQVADRQETKQ